MAPFFVVVFRWAIAGSGRAGKNSLQSPVCAFPKSFFVRSFLIENDCWDSTLLGAWSYPFWRAAALSHYLNAAWYWVAGDHNLALLGAVWGHRNFWLASTP